MTAARLIHDRVVANRSKAWLYSLSGRNPYAAALGSGRPNPFRPSVLFQDNWLDTTGPYPAEAGAARSLTKWPAGGYAGVNHDAFFDPAVISPMGLMQQHQSNTFGLVSKQLTVNLNKQHGVIAQQVTALKTDAGTAKFCTLFGESDVNGTLALSWVVSCIFNGGFTEIDLYRNNALAVSYQLASGALGIQHQVQLDFGPWNGATRTISVYLDGLRVISNVDNAGPTGTNKYCAINLAPGNGGLAADYTQGMGAFTYYGFAS